MKRKTIHQYEIVRKLGAGGSGVVYLANDTLLMRPVVLKILKRGDLPIEGMRTTVLHEARLASAIEHQNVCAIYEVGESEDEAFIVMQYVPGQALDKVIAQGPAAIQLALSVGIQIADGLAAAHELGIYHRDLKPANVMLTDGGLVKILDFGLARRRDPKDGTFDPSASTRRKPGLSGHTSRGGTIAYMAPEQFVTGHSSMQSDIFALGLILYELVAARHPFHRPDADDIQSMRAIQFADPPPLSESAPQSPAELASVIYRCLEKTPAERYSTAAEVREALKTIMRTLQLEHGLVPGDAAANLPTSNNPEAEKRSASFLSLLAERFRESSDQGPRQNSLLLLPFTNLGANDVAPMYGYALADAIGARLARMSSLIIRPASSLLSLGQQPLDPLEIGQRLLVRYVLAGTFQRAAEGFTLNWQLFDVTRQSMSNGGSIHVPSFDLIAVQNAICNEVFATLQGLGGLEAPADRVTRKGSLSQEISEEYLQARALLSSFMQRTGSRDDLDRASELFESVVTRDPSFAAGWAGLGIAQLQYVRHGFGGQMYVMSARRSFDQALAFDPSSVEANLYRVYMLLSRGEKESARHGIEHLLRTAGNDWNVQMVAGTTLRLDGMYDEALVRFQASLRMNPASAPVIYNNRARVYQYQNQLELASEEITKGLTLEPRHPLLRVSQGYQQMRLGEMAQAIDTLEGVIADDANLRIAYPTLALCYAQSGERHRASTLIVEDTLQAAEADSEMAYRLATYFAVDGDESEALHWLRRAIYLGNENYPWFSHNPAWSKLQGHADFDRILEDLKKSFRRNQKTWKRLLEQLPEPGSRVAAQD
jgi:eukaryotic-like serine/threonine-protein kinase